MNVIFLGGFHYPHGMAATKRIQLFINRLNEKSIPVKVITIGNYGDKKMSNPAYGKRLGIEFYNLGAALPKSLLSYFFLPFLILVSFLKLISFKNRDSKNILYVYDSISIDIFSIVLFAKILGYKVITDIVEDYRTITGKLSFQLKLKYKSIIFFEKRIHLFCDAIVVLSLYLKELFEKKLCAKTPVFLIPVSSSIDYPDTDKKTFNSPLRICYSGSFAEKDGIKFLIDAFNKFSLDFPDSELLFSGAGNNPEEIVSHSGSKKVKYAGYLSENEYSDFLINADVLCMTRLNSKFANAGFPFKLGEYLATGNPVIVTDVSDVKNYLNNNVDAKIVEPENADAICNALQSIVQDFDKAKVMGRSGQEKSMKFFSYKTNGDSLIKIMQEV
ncbi:MAG: glycosyltransferase [Ignavibacteria bacterium]|nr:glycosyltransferase [Ignavibacteria bacterium]